jgi:hypothetical protein
MDTLFFFLMRRVVLVPLTVVSVVLIGRVLYPSHPWEVGLSAVIAGALWFLPHIPPEDLTRPY